MKKRYPIGTQTFSTVIEDKCRYVDKTGYVYDIASKYRYVFLSRSRRFGKSLLTSTLHSYFAGEEALFDGLELGKLETQWTRYPILHFDMSMAKHCERFIIQGKPIVKVGVNFDSDASHNITDWKTLE